MSIFFVNGVVSVEEVLRSIRERDPFKFYSHSDSIRDRDKDMNRIPRVHCKQ